MSADERAAETLRDIARYWPSEPLAARRARRAAAEAEYQRTAVERPMRVPESPPRWPSGGPVDEGARALWALLLLCRSARTCWKLARGERVPPSELDPDLARLVLDGDWQFAGEAPLDAAWVSVPLATLAAAAPRIEETVVRAVQARRMAELAADVARGAL